MLGYIHISPTDRDHTFRVSLENHTDTLRISELYTVNVGMDNNKYPDYLSENEVISQFISGINTIKSLIVESKNLAGSKKKWEANFKVYGQTLTFTHFTPDPSDENIDPIGLDEDGNDGSPDMPIIPGPNLDNNLKPIGTPWFLDVSNINLDAVAKHYGKEILIERPATGLFTPMTNLELRNWLKINSDNEKGQYIFSQLS